MSIVIVDYHKGNLLSVERGLVGAGADVVVTDEADVIRAADAVVLPGVGAFADAAASMEEMGQMEAVRAAVAAVFGHLPWDAPHVRGGHRARAR